MVAFRASQRRMGRSKTGKGMVLPFQPLAMAFHHVYYSVDLPSVSTLHVSSQLPERVLHFTSHEKCLNYYCRQQDQQEQSIQRGIKARWQVVKAKGAQ